MIEIERKFLVRDSSYREAASSHIEMVQGFLNTDPVKTVRVRRMGHEAWITVKGKTDKGGTTRREWEYPIPVKDAEELLKICKPGVVHKRRYHVPVGDHLFEVDEFLDENEGLILAEVELKDPAEPFQKPAWLGREVTGDPAYYNSQLSLKPFKTWNT